MFLIHLKGMSPDNLIETRLGKSMNQRVYAIRLHFVDTLYVNGEIYVTTTISFISEVLRIDGYVDKRSYG